MGRVDSSQSANQIVGWARMFLPCPGLANAYGEMVYLGSTTRNALARTRREDPIGQCLALELKWIAQLPLRRKNIFLSDDDGSC